jgi:2-amino-4-hydroxy-6-hydroxymethyldihydropteridine diphosphokinase
VIERDLGRERGATRWTARTIDLDLVIFGEYKVLEADLELPHPRFRERAFVLLPLAEIAPLARDPVTGERVESLLRACPGRSDAVRVGPLDESTHPE